MSRKFAISYIDRLLAGDAYSDLAALHSAIWCSSRLSLDLPDYGLGHVAFLFVETRHWSCHRSGMQSYHEGTPLSRQAAMLEALRAESQEEFAAWYERGTRDWRDEERMLVVDAWHRAKKEVVIVWLHAFARANRDTFLALT